MGMRVDGIATMKELRNPEDRGYVGWFQTCSKWSALAVNGDGCHHPYTISLKGRMEAINTPRKGTSQRRPIDHATTWTRTVRARRGSRSLNGIRGRRISGHRMLRSRDRMGAPIPANSDATRRATRERREPPFRPVPRPGTILRSVQRPKRIVVIVSNVATTAALLYC